MRTRSILSLLSIFSLAVASPQQQQQKPLAAQPPASEQLHSLADLLTTERRASIFYDYARDNVDITTRLSSTIFQSSILVPANSAIIALPRKPHQSSPEASLDAELTIEQADASGAANIKHFLSAHIIPETIDLYSSSPSPLSFATLLTNHNVTLERSGPFHGEEKWRVQPGDIEVLSVHKASNGLVILIDGVLGQE